MVKYFGVGDRFIEEEELSSSSDRMKAYTYTRRNSKKTIPAKKSHSLPDSSLLPLCCLAGNTASVNGIINSENEANGVTHTCHRNRRRHHTQEKGQCSQSAELLLKNRVTTSKSDGDSPSCDEDGLPDDFGTCVRKSADDLLKNFLPLEGKLRQNYYDLPQLHVQADIECNKEVLDGLVEGDLSDDANENFHIDSIVSHTNHECRANNLCRENLDGIHRKTKAAISERTSVILGCDGILDVKARNKT